LEKNKNIALIGYSGHSFVVLEIFRAMGKTVEAYFDVSEKMLNPYDLKYAGDENDPKALEILNNYDLFISIGDNKTRESIFNKLGPAKEFVNAIHPSSIISGSAKLGKGVMVSAGVIINARVIIGNNVICNTGSIIEHECSIANYVHIAPGAVLCGNVSVEEGAFIGANAVVKEGVRIGKNAIIGAGTVITKDVQAGKKAVGNPQRYL
jgi:sugar O-acyltransferase (sialic acid O-acetyltransferase NeuD family)